MKRRILSIITALALCLSLCPTWAFATEADPSLCKHHPAHTAECGYAAPTEGHDCGHQHTAECYTKGVLPDADGGDPYEVGADTENLLNCHHSHDSECGYVQADPGASCGYVCHICPIEDLIAALPEQVTEDNADDVRGQLVEILALYRELDEDEQGQIDLSRVTELQGALDGANAPMAVAGEININSTRTNILTAEAGGCPGHTFTGTTASPATIYVESGVHDVTFSDLNITSANVGIAPGATMNLTITGTNAIKAGSYAGIYVPKNATLVITAGSTGSLDVSSENCAGIGGALQDASDDRGNTPGDPNCGTVEIKGGTITATGGSGCAGIGGGSDAYNNPGNGGTVTISGGTVTAKGGSDSGYCGGAGIGGSAGVSASDPAGNGGTLTINGGHVTLTPGAYDTDWGAAYGFGQGSGSAPGGTCELTLADASYLDSGTTLDPKGKYTINGDPTADMIVVPEDLIYNGKAQELDGRIYIDESKTGSAEYFGRMFTVNASADGWVLQDLGAVVEAGEYTAVFKKGDKEISKTFTVAKSGTQFVGDGVVKTFNGETQTDTFTAGDTITVKATPTATGTAPAKAAARLRGGELTAGQMAVFVGDTQVSVPADKGEDGSYTMTVSADDVLTKGQAGQDDKYTLIVKFVENTNMAGAEAQVEVTITPNPLTEGMVTLSAESGTYSGTAQKPTVTLTGLAEGTDYEITCTGDFTSAGEHTLTVTGKGVYRGTVEKTYTIGKATPTIAWANSVVTLTYTGQPADIKPVITLVNGETFSGTITYHHTNTDSSESGESKAGLPTNAGIYVVGARIPEQDNYTAAATAFLMLTINKADQTVPAAPTAAEDNIKDNSITLDAIENAEYKRDDGEWQESPTFTGLEPNQAYTFYARLKADDNHNASPSSEGTSITTRKAMLENASVTITGTYTYTGAAIVPEAGNVEVVLNGTKIDSDQYTISASNNINAGVGKATLTVTATENGNYSGSASTTFTINRAALTIAAKPQTITYGGNIAQGPGQVDVTGLCGGDTLESVTLTPSSNQVAVADKTITPSGAVIKRGGKDAAANYNITYQPGALTINKSRPTIAFASGYNPSKTYDGQTIPNPVADNLDITGANFSDVAFEWSATPKDAGTYTLTAKIAETNNTEAASETLSVTISPKIVSKPTIELSPSTFEYDGTAKEPTVTVKDGGTVIPDSEYTVEYSNNTNVGTTATVTVTDNENGNYTVNGTNTFAITAKPLTGAKVGVSGSFTYTGSALTPDPVVTLGEKTLVKDTDYTVAYNKNTNVGTATITITGMGNYSGEASGQFTIGRATLTADGTGTASGTYGAKLSDLTVSGLTAKLGEGTVSGTWALTGETIPNVGDSGEYTATFTPATGVNNYNKLTTKVKLTIAPAQALTPKTGDLAVANKQAHTYTFGLGALRPDVPAGMSFGSGAVTYELGTVSLGDYYVEGAEIEGQTLTLPIVAVESITEDKIGTVTIIIKTGNFEDMTATINVQSVNKIIPTGAPTLSAATITYGQPISAITLSGSMLHGEEPVPGTFAWSSPENRPAAQDSYAAAWVFTPTDNEKYAKVNGTSAVKVLPAPIASAEIVLNPTAFKHDGSAHKPTIESVKLGDATLTLDTDYTPDIPAGTEAGSYTVTVTGKGNYTGTATAKYTINSVKTDELEQKDNSGRDLRLEVETGLSTVPAGLDSKEKYNTPEKIENELRTEVTKVMASEQISVLDVTLQYKDGDTWKNVDPNNFPEGGVTAILPYPEGTGASGYTFTVQHLISSGDEAGAIETLEYELTSDGLKCKFNSLSPVAIGYKKKTSSGGWYPTVSYYSIKIDKPEHGTVTASPTSANSGSTVTLTVKPDEGYKLGKITATDSQNNAIELAEKDGKYTFKMPGREVTVKAEFVPVQTVEPSPEPWKNPFPDVKDTEWYIEAIEYVCTNGLMAGYPNGKFGPNDDLTRAEFAQIIYNKEGRPKAGSGRFTDVTTGWYADAVNWAAAEGIVAGVGGGKFAPDQPITRQDLAVMLWRYAGSPEPRKNELDFSDAGKTSEYAWKALCWANENGIVNGKGSGILDPKGKATRAEAAQMLMNYLKK